MEITLTVTAGPHQGHVFTFEDHDNFIVGRSKRAHFRVGGKDRYFSRIHFMVEVNPPFCRLMDMGSRNGTCVNGTKVVAADLKDGDEITAGRTTLRVTITAALPQAVVEECDALVPGAVSQAVYGTIGASRAKSPPPSPRPVVEPGPVARPLTGPRRSAGASCLVCSGQTGPIPKESMPSGWPLCSGCLATSQKLEQAITGFYLLRELGRGGMGVVYLALNTESGEVLALKTLIPAVAAEQTDIDRFIREARILRELDHPHIVRFRDMGACKGQMYFAMDYVRGADAGKLLKDGGPFEVCRAVRLTCQLLEALEYAHGRGYVHRDLKPANLLVAERDGREIVKLADLGLARDYQMSKLSGLTIKGDLGGTAAFMPPEQITNFRDAKPASDQYSTGATLYNLLTNKHIYDFPKAVHEQLLLILERDPVPIRSRRTDLPKGLPEVIHRALAREPDMRFADVKAMQEALAGFAS